MKNKSTHQGHCQACGRLQMLPGGLLSKHGYNVTHGFFSGVCAGAGSLPFEQSCDLVKRFIELAQADRVRVQKKIDTLLTPATTDTKAWVHVHYSARELNAKSSVKVWEQVTLVATFTPFSDGKSEDHGYTVYSYTDARGRQHGSVSAKVYGVDCYTRGDVENARLQTVSKFNATFATWTQHELDSLDRYIAWQTERVTTWKPAELLALGAKSKAGFKPTEPKY